MNIIFFYCLFILPNYAGFPVMTAISMYLVLLDKVMDRYKEHFGCGGAGCWCGSLRYVRYVMYFISRRNVRGGIYIALTSFRSTILVFKF